jgi:hypothetical protein
MLTTPGFYRSQCEKASTLKSLCNRLNDIVQAMHQKKGAQGDTLVQLHNAALSLFLQIQESSRQFYSNGTNMNDQHNHTLSFKPSQIDDLQSERQFYASQLQKMRRENEEINNYLERAFTDAEFQRENIQVEITNRIRMGKYLEEMQKKLKTLKGEKLSNEKRLRDLNESLKKFLDSSKSLQDYQNKVLLPVSPYQPLASSLPTPLFILYELLEQNINAYKKQNVMSVLVCSGDEMEGPSDITHVHHMSLLWKVRVKAKPEYKLQESLSISMKFHFLPLLEMVVVNSSTETETFDMDVIGTTTGARVGFSLKNNVSRDYVATLVPGDDGARMPTSSKAISHTFNTSSLPGRPYEWLQALCGYSVAPHSSLTMQERVFYDPLRLVSNFVKAKPEEQIQQQTMNNNSNNEVNNAGGAEDQQLEEIEVDGGNVGALLMEEDEGENASASNTLMGPMNEDGNMGDTEAIEMQLDGDNKMTIEGQNEAASALLLKKQQRGNSIQVSVVVNLYRMIKGHWRKNYIS